MVWRVIVLELVVTAAADTSVMAVVFPACDIPARDDLATVVPVTVCAAKVVSVTVVPAALVSTTVVPE